MSLWHNHFCKHMSMLGRNMMREISLSLIHIYTIAEDSPEYDKIDFRMDIFEAFTRGYLESAQRFLTPLEVSLLPYAAELFPYMQCVRFLWDRCV